MGSMKHEDLVVTFVILAQESCFVQYLLLFKYWGNNNIQNGVFFFSPSNPFQARPANTTRKLYRCKLLERQAVLSSSIRGYAVKGALAHVLGVIYGGAEDFCA